MKVALLVLFLAASLSCIRTASSSQPLGCFICEYLVGEVENYLANNATETEILAKLGDACTILADPSWVSECKTVVASKGAALIQYIINEETPEVACSQIGFSGCTSSLAIAPPKPVGDSVACGICVFLVGRIEDYVENNATESEILAFLEKDCAILGIKSWVAVCKSTVATFGPEIIKLVIDKQPADVVCSEVGLCSNSSSTVHPHPMVPVPVKPAEKNDSSLTCTLCELLVSYTEKFLAENKTESEIIKELTGVCAILPIKSWATACDDMVKEYGSIIISYLINEQPPEVVCTEIKLCTSVSVPINKECVNPESC
jgi:saposin